ncbi:MAG: hypothetical protein CSA72_06960 [Rhodobacterales bacterium]|nr:MAG: hypothetical protein CSA72_06960 [Rhodobacterales bacterium]
MSSATLPVLTPIRLREGIWEGQLSGLPHDATPPLMHVMLGNRSLGSPNFAQQQDGTWLVRVTVPPEAVSDGVQAFSVVSDAGDILASFALIAGDVLRDDLRAEVALLRAELDMLKRAFRRTARATEG